MDGEVSPAEVNRLLEEDANVRVVDVRSRESFARGHIPGSECIPFDRLPDDVERLDGASRVVTVCPHGKASVQAARLVAAYEGVPSDARVQSMAGGLADWECDLESDSSHPPEGPAEGDSEPDAPF